MEELNESLYDQVLKFDETTKTRWMNERKAYAVLFELTSKCNFNCVHCYLQNFHAPDELTTEQVKNILDILCEKGILFLTLTGGEILARRDFLEIYLYAKKKGFLVELFTNGYLFSDDVILALQEYPPLLVSISLYGANDDTYEKITGVKGAFSVVKENCYKLKNAGIRVALKSPILTYTLPEMQDMKRVADEMGLQLVFSFDIHDTIDGSDKPREYQTKLSDALRYEFDERIQKLADRKQVTSQEDIWKRTKELQSDTHVYTCNVAMNSFVIDYKGNMLPCMKLRHKGINLLSHSFDDIWEQFSIYKKFEASEKNKCKRCDAVYFCDSCPAEMDGKYGDMEVVDCKKCKVSKIRKAFYCGEMDYDEALKQADL